MMQFCYQFQAYFFNWSIRFIFLQFNNFIQIVKDKNIMFERDFIMLGKLGSGAYGHVYKVKRISDLNQYAIKKVRILDMSQKQKTNALNEIRLLASLRHQNIISYKEAFYEEKTQSLCTVMELAENGDLSALIKEKSQNGQFFYNFQIVQIATGILRGLNTLHQARILHRDLKPANIFFGKNNVPKIGDMNVSIMLNSEMAHTQIGTPYYTSIQVWENQPYSFDCDVWSFGCILYQMCTLKPPFKAKNIDNLYQKIKHLKYQKIPDRYSLWIAEMIQLCLRPKNCRANVRQLLRQFEKYQMSLPKRELQLKKSKSAQILLKTINIPADYKNFNKILPKSRYKVQQQNNQLDPKIDEQSSTSLGKKQENVRKKAIEVKKPRLISINKINPTKPLVILGSSSNNSLKRLQIYQSKKKIIQILSPKNQPRSFLDIKIPHSYLKDLVCIRSQKCLKKQKDFLKDQMQMKQDPSFISRKQSQNMNTIEKISVQRLNVKRRKLRMALNY